VCVESQGSHVPDMRKGSLVSVRASFLKTQGAASEVASTPRTGSD
jgi:hypothetical protein